MPPRFSGDLFRVFPLLYLSSFVVGSIYKTPNHVLIYNFEFGPWTGGCKYLCEKRFFRRKPAKNTQAYSFIVAFFLPFFLPFFLFFYYTKVIHSKREAYHD